MSKVKAYGSKEGNITIFVEGDYVYPFTYRGKCPEMPHFSLEMYLNDPIENPVETAIDGHDLDLSWREVIKEGKLLKETPPCL